MFQSLVVCKKSYEICFGKVTMQVYSSSEIWNQRSCKVTGRNQSLANLLTLLQNLSPGGIEPPTRFSKRGGLTGPPFLEGVAGKKGGLFSGGAIFW